MLKLLQSIFLSFFLLTSLGSTLDAGVIGKKTFTPTKHSIHQKINRGVTSKSINDALKNPLQKNPVKADSLGRPSQRYIGEKAEVAVNPNTNKIVSVNPTSKQKAEKLKKAQNDNNKP